MRVVLYARSLSDMAGLSEGLQQRQHPVTTITLTAGDIEYASRIARAAMPDCALVVFPGLFDARQYTLAYQRIGHHFGGLTLLCRVTSELSFPRLVRVEGEAQAMFWFEAAPKELLDADWLASALRTAEINRFVQEPGPFNVPQPKRRVAQRAPHHKKPERMVPPKTDGRGRGSKRLIQISVGSITLKLLPEQCRMLAWFVVHVGQKFTAAKIVEELGLRRIARCSPHSVTHSIIPLRNKMNQAGISLIQMDTKTGHFSFVDQVDWAARLREVLDAIELCQPILALEKKPARKVPKVATTASMA